MLTKLIASFLADKDVNKVNYYLNSWIIDLFLIKNEEWSLQKEWRFIGKAKSIIAAPKITAIYLGSRAPDEDVDRIKQIAKRKGIKLYMQSEDYETMKIVYNEIEQ